MSSDSAAEARDFFTILYTSNYCYVAASVLFFYDTFITIDREVACFWPAKRTGAPLLFFANKWISVMFYVMVLVSGAPFPSDQRSVYSLAELQSPEQSAFSALRAYVLSKSKLLGLLVFALSLAPVGANLVRWSAFLRSFGPVPNVYGLRQVHYGYRLSGENIPPLGCFTLDSTTVALDLRLSRFILNPCSGTDSVQGVVVIISRIPLMAADILLIYITWTKLSSWGASRDIRQKRFSLSDILFRGGIIYFITLFMLNVLHLVFTVTLAGTTGAGQSDVTIFTAPITAILISRFLLELQEANRTVVRLDPDDPLHSARDPFDNAPSFISSLEGFVHPALSARSDDHDSFDFES
ncbi:hypothetical protein K466DRAFT_665346 [Polyporus arcularius HHB13444]|uniref:DUF6533 domain-containing protein n=1 Tax=Polyporus arcularius HHB13444 TaxID=1314778 RepID=A0A5C3P4I0_9APHY|nr:hypothetical protein K466DRAFT_665346 [Polyporus arcularius HHB13444]